MRALGRLFFLPGRFLDWTLQSENPARIAARQGQAAHDDGLPLSRCPYAEPSLRSAWTDGWRSADESGPIAF